MSGGGLKYVKDFDFPSDRGFTGSAGKSEVKGYMRGGAVKKGGKRNTPCKSKKLAKGTTRAAMGGYMGPEREITVDDVKITTPARAKGGRMRKSTHDKLMAHGKKMGYKTGGYVPAKNTSSEFKAKRGKQDSMDSGVQPARRGANARSQQEREAGGTGRLKPGLAKGGKVRGKKTYVEGGALARVAAKGLKKLKGTMSDADRRAMRGKASPDKTKGKGMSKKGMPKTVKARGGAVAAGDKKTHPKGRGRKPYSGYNKQPAGHGAPSARYLGKRGAARSR